MKLDLGKSVQHLLILAFREGTTSNLFALCYIGHFVNVHIPKV